MNKYKNIHTDQVVTLKETDVDNLHHSENLVIVKDRDDGGLLAMEQKEFYNNFEKIEIENFEELGKEIGAFTDLKNKKYGDSFAICGEFLKLLYPDKITPDQYTDALALVRIFDKQKRIATDKDALGESPFKDISGYGLLGTMKDM